MIDLSSLNREQHDAARQFRGSMMILAGAGTGKTRVVTYRIANMLSCGVDPRSIAAMTFTNKAAKEMQDRIGMLVGKEKAQEISISTFHSFCLKILRTWPKAVGLPPKFSLVGTGDQLDLVRRGLEERNWQGLYRAEDFHYQIGQCKNWLLSPEDVENGISPPACTLDHEVLSVVYRLYERQLQLNRAIDFDDCIFKVVKLLREQPKYSKKLQDKYQYFLVDEFQDTNASQFAVLEEIAKEHGNICVVGDDDQSIYSWRGAMYETLERFEKTFSDTKIIKLEQNYRCTNVILKAANQLITNNVQRKGKTLWSSSTENKPIVLASFDSAGSEAQWIAKKCLSLLGRGYSLGQIAILYRANAQAKTIEMALKECSLTYKTYGGQSFFERKEVKDFLAYVRLIVNKDDHLALWRIINSPPRGIGLKTQEHIEEIAGQFNKSPFDTILDPSCCSLLSSAAKEAVSSFADMMKSLMSLPLNSPDECRVLGEKIISSSGMVPYIKSHSKNHNSRQHKINNLESLPGWLQKSAEDAANLGPLDTYQLLDNLTLGEGQKFKQENENDQHISLMTVHGSKGLEFQAVFIVGLEEGGLPHKNSLEDENAICEERRLFYVALTRAKKELFLSYAYLRQSGFQKERREKSRFLQELPKDKEIVLILDKEDPSEKKSSQDELKTGAISKFAMIKANLKNDHWAK